jgi:PAS domain S-box-containing protein
VVVKEDLHLLENFMTAVRNGETAATIFRIRDLVGMRWIKLTGTVYRKNPRFYLGYMLDCSDTAAIVQTITEKDSEVKAMIEMVDNPVLLVDLRDKTVAAHNAAARDLFGYGPPEFSGLKFSDLYHESVETLINRIYEEAIFEKKWEGRLTFRRKAGAPFHGDVTIRRLYFEGRRLFRISVDNVYTKGESLAHFSATGTSGKSRRQAEDQAYRDKLTAKVSELTAMDEILTVLLENQSDGMGIDAIIYSDVYARKNKVVVYTAGGPLAAMSQGEVFPFEGTIAENIERYKLDYLIVDDTFSSIKAIDWALFIPHGIRSYFAQPFYERKLLRSVLILCSVESNAFSDTMVDTYSLLYQPFLTGLKAWRKAARRSKRV